MAVFFYVLVVLDPGPTSGLKVGFEQVGERQYFSESSCKEDARLIAQALFAKSGIKYGFKCKPVSYEPPDLDKSK